MPSKGNPYPSRESSSRQEPSSPANNKAHSDPYSGRGFVKRALSDLIRGPKLPEHIKPEAGKAAEPKSIFEKRKEGLHPSEIRAEFKRMSQFQTKMDSDERLDLANELAKKYPTAELKDVIKEERKEAKEASLGDTRKERLDATHRIGALKILEKRKEK